MSTIGYRIASAARSYVGTPFVHHGRRPGVGLDCAGVAFCAAWDAGLAVADERAYGKLPKPDFLLDMLSQRCNRIKEHERLPGDVLLFTYGKGNPAHFAVLEHDDRIVHALELKRKVLCVPLGPAWRERLHSYWRFKGVS